MKLKFDSTLQHQQKAIDAVVDVFTGQPIMQSQFEVCNASGDGMNFSEHGVGNNIVLNDEQLLENVRKIQERNDIPQVNALQQGREFSIEMETGTGKTYVYLRTIFELSKQYGLRKFIVVVPSVAIREGVMKSVEMVEEHFRAIYGNAPFNCFIYDSKKLGGVRQFAVGNEIQIMVINIQAFSKDAGTDELSVEQMRKLNVINRENDKMSGYKPIDFIGSTNPIVIIDEPQSVDNTEKAKRAIKKLKPSATLRYSATHRNEYNLLYKLDPIAAYDLQLVKQIEVASILAENDFNDAFVKLTKTDNTKGIKAKVEIHKETKGKVKVAALWVKKNDDLYKKSGERACYRHGYVIQRINCKSGAECIEFTNGKRLDLNAEIGAAGDDIMKAQVRKTISQHLEKESMLKGKGIKVLSLFFIDRVENYRVHHADGSTSLGKIGEQFEKAYREICAKPRYTHLACDDLSKIHDGYFSKDRTGKSKNTRGNTKDDNDTYSLIMRDKERLLDPQQPLRFIFSHSALREGWDNPNVFQICTLNETKSTEKKRQEIGRGLRLPVNAHGERIHDQNTNRLTVIANESYEDFARALQNEFEEDCGIRFGYLEKLSFAKITRLKKDGTEEAIGQEESGKIFAALVAAEYIAQDGKILPRFEPDDPDFELNIDAEFGDIKNNIKDEIKGYMLETRVKDARKKQTLTFKKEVHLSQEFKDLWNKIKWRTRYQVKFDSERIVEKAAQRIAELEKIEPPRINITETEINVSKAGVKALPVDTENESEISVRILPDLLEYLQKETELTRHTLLQILKNSKRLDEFRKNPQKFMSVVAREINYALQGLVQTGIQYVKIPNAYWRMERIAEEAEEEMTRYFSNLYKVKNEDKCLFDAVECDSEVEKQFAKDLDNNQNVRLFVKLPRWFKIDTPVGPYNPDWAFMTERDEKLYFVGETKGTPDKRELRVAEGAKIGYGKQHFEALDVKYEVVRKLGDFTF